MNPTRSLCPAATAAPAPSTPARLSTRLGGTLSARVERIFQAALDSASENLRKKKSRWSAGTMPRLTMTNGLTVGGLPCATCWLIRLCMRARPSAARVKLATPACRVVG